MKLESYNKAQQEFETAKKKKLTNIKNQIALIENKINSLVYQKTLLSDQLDKTSQKEFPSFEEFDKQSKEQSKIDKEKYQSALNKLAEMNQ